MMPDFDQEGQIFISTPHSHDRFFSFLNINLLKIQRLQLLGPVVQSVVSLTSSLRVISLTVLVDSIHNILIFFAEKM